MAETANIYQFAFLLVRFAVRSFGIKPTQELIRENKLSDKFSINELGVLEIKFDSFDPQAITYYKRFFDAFILSMEKTFGKQYIQNLLLEQYNKLKSWSQTSDEAEGVKLIAGLIGK